MWHVCWPRLTAKRVEPVVSISWASCNIRLQFSLKLKVLRFTRNRAVIKLLCFDTFPHLWSSGLLNWLVLGRVPRKFPKNNLWEIDGARFLQAGRNSCHPINGSKDWRDGTLTVRLEGHSIERRYPATITTTKQSKHDDPLHYTLHYKFLRWLSNNFKDHRAQQVTQATI